MRHSLYSSIVTIWVVDSCWGHPWERAEKALVRRAKPEKTIHTCVNSHSATITANTQTHDWKNLQSKRKWCSHMNVHTLACTHYCPQNHNSQFSLHLKKKKGSWLKELSEDLKIGVRAAHCNLPPPFTLHSQLCRGLFRLGSQAQGMNDVAIFSGG